MVNHYVMSAAALAAMVAGTALAGPGVSYTYTITPGTGSFTTTTFTGYSLNLGTSAPAGNWVDARVRFTPTGSLASANITGIALASAAPTSGTATATTYAGGTTVYSTGSASSANRTWGYGPGTNSNFFTAAFYNQPLATTYTGGTSLVLNMRSTTSSSATFSGLSVTLFQLATADITGTVAGAGTYTRPNAYFNTVNNGSALVANGASPTSSGLSARYNAQAFSVSTSGLYFISMMSTSSSTVYGSLYSSAFDPLNPLTNLMTTQTTFYGTSTQPSVGGTPRAGFTSNGSDMLTWSGGSSGIQLTAGQTYYYVYSDSTTSSANFSVYFEGPGTVTVPTPGAMALMGLGGLAMARRRR